MAASAFVQLLPAATQYICGARRRAGRRHQTIHGDVAGRR
jgi:hypothetical protein